MNIQILGNPTLILVLIIIAITVTSVIIINWNFIFEKMKFQPKGTKQKKMKSPSSETKSEKVKRTPLVKNFFQSAFFIAAFIVVIFLGIHLLFGILNSARHFFDVPPQTEIVRKTKTLDIIEVSFDSVYGQMVDLSKYGKGFQFEFIGATQPYCVKNADKVTAYGDKKENVSPQLGISWGNLNLWFRSTNGLKGKLKIKVYVYI